MPTEWREERCEDCGDMIERAWVVRTRAIGAPIPAGFKVEHRGTSWTTDAAPTEWVTLCLCYAP
jgi:hypothetical protein